MTRPRIFHEWREERRQPFPVVTLILLVVAGFVLGGWLGLIAVAGP